MVKTSDESFLKGIAHLLLWKFFQLTLYTFEQAVAFSAKYPWPLDHTDNLSSQVIVIA